MLGLTRHGCQEFFASFGCRPPLVWCTLPCIDATFGPTEPGIYWSDTFAGSMPIPPVTFHAYVDFGTGNIGTATNGPTHESTEAHFVRAVRGGG